MSDVIDLLERPYLTVGLRMGLAALAVGWLWYLVLARKRRPVPIAGLLIAGSTVATLYLIGDPLDSAVPALVLIVSALAVTRVFDGPAWIKPLMAIPGAAWLAFATPLTALTWVRILVFVMIPLAGFLITDFETRHDQLGLGVIFFTLAVLGVFAAVPDTEWALSLLAVSLPLTFLAWPRIAGSLGPEGAYAAVAVFMLVTVSGGHARPPSIIGSAACLGFLLLEPLIVATKPRAVKLISQSPETWLGAVMASIPQFIIVVVCSRIAARFHQELPAVLVVGVAYGVALVVGFRLTESLDLPPKAVV